MKRFLYLTTALATMLALSAPAAQAEHPVGQNGPALDGRQVALPDGLSVDGASEVQLFEGPSATTARRSTAARWPCRTG